MNIFAAVILLVVGLIVLWKCADLLVAGAVEMAAHFGVSPVVIGMTVVAMGTSAPELAAGVAAALRGTGNVAIGNVFGSNIANLALVGGLCALIRPIKIQQQMLKREIPAMLAVAVLLLPFLYNCYLARLEGFVLLSLFAVLLAFTVNTARKQNANKPQSASGDSKSMKKNVLLVVAGLVGLALGAEATVRGAVFIGQRVGLSNAVIGLTIVAIGTSLPELVTCMAASLKGHHDISAGNLVGSNIFNTLLVTGTAGLVRPFGLAQRLASVDYWIMLIVTVVFCLIAVAGKKISKAGGFVLLAGYIGYMVYLLA